MSSDGTVKIVLYGAPVLAFRDRLAASLGFGADIATVGYGDREDRIAAAFDGADAMVGVRYDGAIPPDASLRLVQVPGVGCDEIEMALLPPGAMLCNVHEHEKGSAEYVVWTLLQWRHRLCEADASFRGGSWDRSSRFGAPPHGEIAGSTVTIVGLGRIGLAVARRLKAFDVTVIGVNRSRREWPSDVDRVFGLEDLTTAVRDADFVVVCVALTDRTRGLIDQTVFSAMRADAVLVNVARGPVVEEDALFAALRSGRIGGAAIDVWYRYPEDGTDMAPSRHDFASLSNVIMTPHISGWTTGTVDRRWQLIAENLHRLHDGRPLLGIVHDPSGRKDL